MKGKLVGESDWKLSRGIINLGLGESGGAAYSATPLDIEYEPFKDMLKLFLVNKVAVRSERL